MDGKKIKVIIPLVERKGQKGKPSIKVVKPLADRKKDKCK